MEPDIDAMLRRVVDDVSEGNVEVVFDSEAGRPHVRRAKLASGSGPHRRTVGLSASSTGWFAITIFDLHVSATLFEYDDAAYMEAILRDLALVALAYVRGEGRVEMRRGLLRTRPVLVVRAGGNEWTLGRRASMVHYPQTGEDPR